MRAGPPHAPSMAGQSASCRTGAINGQAGWLVFSASGQTSAPVIETTVVKTGAQAVGVPGSVTGQTDPIFAPNLTNPVLDLSAEIFLANSANESAWQFGTTGSISH
jgi:hypothetical protein